VPFGIIDRIILTFPKISIITMYNFLKFSTLSCVLGVLLLYSCTQKQENKEVKISDFKKNRDTSVHTTPLVLWFSQPATQSDTTPYANGNSTNVHGNAEGKGWDEALPIGNGRIAAMVFGGIKRERIQLNEESLWSGKKIENTNQDAVQEIKDMRNLIFEGKYDEAQTLAEQKLTGNLDNLSNYQSLGDLFIEMTDIQDESVVTDYYRDLHIDSAIATVHFKIGDKLYTREIFASYPDNVLVMKLSCNQPGSINARVSLARESGAETFRSPFDSTFLVQRGTIASNGLLFETQLKATYKGGTVHNDTRKLVAENVDELILYISAATNYKTPEHAVLAKQILLSAIAKDYDQLKSDHIASYKTLFNNVELNLNFKDKAYDVSTDKRVEKVKGGTEDKYLTELLFQYGRYLLICSSRPDNVPANMQGLWNEHLNPVFGSGYKTNWTLPLVYSHADATNLGELKKPLVDLIETSAGFGAQVAKSMYGTEGWVAHDFVSIYGNDLPTMHSIDAVSPLGGAWLANLIFESYQYNQDKEFLKNKAYPLMKGAAQFVIDNLVTVPTGLPAEGKLVVSPSMANGNPFVKEDGTISIVSYGSSVDQMLAYDLLNNTLKAIDELSAKNYKFDPQFRAKVSGALDNLARVQKDASSNEISEWVGGLKSAPGEKAFISQLYGLYPSNQISKNLTPELADAAAKTLESNLPNLKKTSFGYSLAAIWWARLDNAAKADEYLLKQIKSSLSKNLMSSSPPFAIDGNMAFTTAITEMLLQSQDAELNLVPALPATWEEGSYKGFKARGGFSCDVEWGNGKVYATITSLNGNTCRLRAKSVKIFDNGSVVEATKIDNNLYEFRTEEGKKYTLTYVGGSIAKGGSSKGLGIWPDLGTGIDLGINL
jgi:alpha-L-fucosidase 2